MTFVVSGRAKYTQAQGVLESSLFQEYDCAEGAKFGINLTTLLECLQIFGPASLAQTSVSMAFQEVSCFEACGCGFSIVELFSSSFFDTATRPTVDINISRGTKIRGVFFSSNGGSSISKCLGTPSRNTHRTGSLGARGHTVVQRDIYFIIVSDQNPLP